MIRSINKILKKRVKEKPIYDNEYPNQIKSYDTTTNEYQTANAETSKETVKTHNYKVNRSNSIHKGQYQIAGHSTNKSKTLPRIKTFKNQPEYIYKLFDQNDERCVKELKFYEYFEKGNKGSKSKGIKTEVIPKFYGKEFLEEYGSWYLKLENVATSVLTCTINQFDQKHDEKERHLISFADIKIGKPLPSTDLLTLPKYRGNFWRIFRKLKKFWRIFEKFGAFSRILSIFGVFLGQKRINR